MDRYEKIEVVGRGAFGVVTLYSEKSTGRKVVIKHIPVQQMSKEEKEGSLNEAKVLAMLHHPNIIAYYDSFLEEKSLAIVMEYAPGGNLYDYLKQRGRALLSEREVLSYFAQVLLALEHVHSRKILHRDLKTQNLLLNQCRSIVKVGDFGISKILSSKSKAESLVGTPNNLSPEVFVGKPYNHKSDIWALGCILYELLTLRSPFEGNHIPSLVRKIMRGSYEPVSDHYSAQIHLLLEQLLQKEPSQRPSVNQLMAQPILLPVICNLYLTIGSLPCVAQKDRLSSTLSLASVGQQSRASSGDLSTSLLVWESKSAAPVKLEVPDGHGCVSDVAVGVDSVVAVTSYGSAIVWKVPSPAREKTCEAKVLKDYLSDRITRAGCGADFIILLSERKILLSCGRGQSGSLGHGGHFDSANKPKIVQALLGHEITHVACAASHVLAIDENHDIYAWGDARHGMLGIDFSTSTDLPVKVELPGGVRPMHCFCTMDSSYLVTDAGELWACGSNRNKKLGINDGRKHIGEFTEVPRRLFAGHHVIHVTGNENTTMILTDVGMVFLLGLQQYSAATSDGATARMVSLGAQATHVGCAGDLFVAVLKGTKLVQWKHLKPDNKPEEIYPAPQLPDNVQVVALACSPAIIAAVVAKGQLSKKC
ncbi:serine/threonine-protein kinase Nek8 [Dermacentor andersoni]|uniref:serine/threonine-protein kinase Nek8 n=1 Tax=Dermacentor andersoni TaxID=34620 RepID=UPI002154FF00|nr:serine/threonine-protein kinase Nek8-like [Dermacentor andersoni]